MTSIYIPMPFGPAHVVKHGRRVHYIYAKRYVMTTKRTKLRKMSFGWLLTGPWGFVRWS